MATILIFGGAGFVGSHMAQRLHHDGHRVVAFDNFHRAANMSPALAQVQERRIAALSQWAQIEQGDVRDPARVLEVARASRPDAMIFLSSLLASESKANPDDAVGIHVTGLINVLNALRQSGACARLVYASSSFVYGHFQSDMVNEHHPRNPIDVYGRTKLAGEELCHVTCGAASRELVILRPAAIYGYEDSRGRLVDFMIRRALSGEPIPLWEPHARADFTFVHDAVDGFIRALFSKGAASHAFNLTRGESRSNEELANLICSAIPGAVVQRSESGTPFDSPRRGTMDVAKARELLGFEPKFRLEDAIPRLVEQYRQGTLFALPH